MKILISDLDNDIVLNGKEQIESIKRFTREGNIFICATDKAINYIADHLSLIDINIEYFICNDGAAIFDKYYNIIYRKDMRSDVVRPIINMLKDDDNILETFIDTTHGFVSDAEKCANGIVARPFDKEKAEVLLNKIVLKYPSVHGHVNDNWLNIIDIEVNKKTAIEYLIDNYHLNKDDIYVLGQGVNDLEMVENFKSYVLKDSKEDLKKFAIKEVENISELVDILLEDNTEKNNDYIDEIEPYFE